MTTNSPWWDKLKARRLEVGMSAYGLAKATKLSHQYIMKLEKGGVKEPSYAKLSLITSALSVSVADIFEDNNRVVDGASDPYSGLTTAQSAIADPQIRDIHQNVLAIKELSPPTFDAVKKVVAALKLEAEQEAKAARRAAQNSRKKQSDQRSGK